MEKKQEKWVVAAKRADFQAISQKFGIDPVTARIIRNRGIVGDAAIEEYLHGSLQNLYPPELLKGCREAATLLREKIRAGKRLRIIGDYDIDGVNATYILHRVLSSCGAEVDFEIPDRMRDGYGLNLRLLEYALEEGIDTVITCDNGIAALDEIAYAKEKGLTVVVTDHHEPLYEENGDERVYRLPAADVVVNPKQPDCPYPFKKLCGAAVAWKLAIALCQAFGKPPSEEESLLPFVGFATVGDVMDLEGENRILVREGLKRLRNTENPGLRALIEVNGLAPESITAYHIGFVLGPCINASGRLDTARRSMRLLLARTREEALELAEQLKALNDERKYLTQQAVEEACRLIDSGVYGGWADQAGGSGVYGDWADRMGDSGVYGGRADQAGDSGMCGCRAESVSDDGMRECQAGRTGTDVTHERRELDRVLVVYLPDCHESIAGIVAGKLRERYYRPVFVVTDAGEDAKGSGRSIEGYSMFEEMVKVSDLFLKFGGHPMAAGFSLERGRIGEMRRRLNENCTLTGQELTEKVTIDVPMPIDYISERLVEELPLLEPFGKGNEKPLFAESGLQLLGARLLGKQANVLKFRVMNRAGRTLDALYFGDVEAMREYLAQRWGEQRVQELFWGRGQGMELDLTYYPSVNEYMGRKSLQIVIKHYR